MKFILLKKIYIRVYIGLVKRTNLTNNLNDKQDSTPCSQYMVTDLFTRAGKKKKRAKNPPDNSLSRKSNCTADWNIFAQS